MSYIHSTNRKSLKRQFQQYQIIKITKIPVCWLTYFSYAVYSICWLTYFSYAVYSICWLTYFSSVVISICWLTNFSTDVTSNCWLTYFSSVVISICWLTYFSTYVTPICLLTYFSKVWICCSYHCQVGGYNLLDIWYTFNAKTLKDERDSLNDHSVMFGQCWVTYNLHKGCYGDGWIELFKGRRGAHVSYHLTGCLWKLKTKYEYHKNG